MGFAHRRQLDLGLFGRLPQPGKGGLVLPRVEAVGPFKFLRQVIGDRFIEIVAAQAVVAGGGQHLDDPALDIQHRDVEGPAAEVIDHHFLGLFLVDPVGQRRRGRLVNNSHDV